jgi:dTDP-4-amino-4,6-dideoxygalactose transaminase
VTDRREIRLARPDTDHEEVAEVEAVLASGYLTQGPKVTEFEGLVAELIGVPYAFATTSATTALHLSLAALGIGPGDEVLVPDYTFPATANVVVQQGARPVLVDIDTETFTVTADALEQGITPRTRAMIPVHAFGLSADMDPILALARERGVPVIEDAACALATTYFGRSCGGLGTAGCFSFHPRKAITTGEGGMITTRDDELAKSIVLLRSHGGVRRGNRFTFEAAGFNYRLSDILAAVGVAQLRKLESMVARRRAAASRYRDLLAEMDLLRLPVEPAWGGHVYQSFVVLLDEGIDRDAVIRTLAEQGIETTLGTYALHREPFFGRSFGYQPGDLPASDAAYRRSLALPMYATLEADDQAYVADQLRAALARAHARVS